LFLLVVKRYCPYQKKGQQSVKQENNLLLIALDISRWHRTFTLLIISYIQEPVILKIFNSNITKLCPIL
jgi:hypothetical protein